MPVRVCFHLRGAVVERSPLSRAEFWVPVFSCCVWRCGGGAEAGVRGGSAERVLEPFFRSALRSGSGLETIGINSLEVSKPLYWYKKYPDRPVIWQENQLFCCCSVCEISERLESFKYQSPGFGIPRNVRIKHFRVRFHLCGAVVERSPLGGADFGDPVFSCCVFPLWRCRGGCPRRVRRMGPGAIFPLRPAER